MTRDEVLARLRAVLPMANDYDRATLDAAIALLSPVPDGDPKGCPFCGSPAYALSTGKVCCPWKGCAMKSEMTPEAWNCRAAAQPAPTDTARLDWLEKSGNIAENKPAVRVWAIAAHLEWTLREAIDAAKAASTEEVEP